MRSEYADISDRQETQRFIPGPDTEAQELSPIHSSGLQHMVPIASFGSQLPPLTR